MNNRKELKRQIKDFPDGAGIYLFYNKDEELIYVGKASSLKTRVRSYFKNSKRKTAREVFRPIEEMIEQVDKIDYKETDSALEAILLESEFIKKYQPKYNVMGKDNKSWNYLVITKQKYPTLETIRQHQYKQLSEQQKEERYEDVFGPYPQLNTKATLKILRKLFKYSTCQTEQTEGKPCLYYQMNLCLGVCTGEISAEEYRKKVIKPLKKFLSGEKSELIKQLKDKMETVSENKNFEEAARLRDQIKSLERIHDVAVLNESFIENTLSLNKLEIERVEAYDISHLGKEGKVGSMVVSRKGKLQKNQYRKFKIKTVEGQNDVDCIREVIDRRSEYIGINDDFAKADPDLILIDGGKAQVNAVREVLEDKNIQIPVFGISKGPDRDKNELIVEGLDPRIIKWIKNHKNTLIQLRDEAHRFALKYQKKVREKRFK